ncbi:dual specificity mitogen-activated protein kinase kinase 7-like [Tubulanus polymorphus]|uniref:dual specificity mitogen-activated protein kinase kinase 7-like n=1 Tax=Tubulanus polymorphus TaxID=672921 RepID=UPI003DA60FCD
MATSSFHNKLNDLEAKLKAENESRRRDRNPRNWELPVKPKPMGLPLPLDGSFSGFSTVSATRPTFAGVQMRAGSAPASSRQRHLNIPMSPQPKPPDGAEIEKKYEEIMKQTGILTLNGQKYRSAIKDLDPLGELGHGTCGHVVKMLHKQSRHLVAVKQMRRSGNREENKRIIMDLDVVLKCHDCPYIVQCVGAFITSSDVWICMELMSTCFDKLIRKLKGPMPERILGKLAVATLKALNYLKEVHGVIHRDIKPSNILLDECGRIKLCDFGISGRLVDSKAKTRSAGCAAYMAPERIDPPNPTKPDYDIRADVWSLGISLVELATGEFPYKNCKTDFEVLTRVLQEDPPSLPAGRGFSLHFCSFVTDCLTKDFHKRPKYRKLLEHGFILHYEMIYVDVASWYLGVRQMIEFTSGGATSAAGVS